MANIVKLTWLINQPISDTFSFIVLHRSQRFRLLLKRTNLNKCFEVVKSYPDTLNVNSGELVLMNNQNLPIATGRILP